jgi:hypothetical protein
MFTFSTDVSFTPRVVGQEAGVTIFLTQFNHIDLGIVLLAPDASTSSNSKGKPQLSFRFRTIGTIESSEPTIVPVPATWAHGPIRLEIQTANATHYNVAAMPAANPNAKIILGTASARLISGGSGSFVGSLVGAYATCNGEGTGLDCPAGGNAYFKRWRYTGAAQYISATEIVPEL